MENPGNRLPADCFTEIASFINDPKDLLSLMQASKKTYAGIKQFALLPVYSDNPTLLSMQLFLRAFISSTLDQNVKFSDTFELVCQELKIETLDDEVLPNKDIIKILDYLVAINQARLHTKFQKKAYKKLINLEYIVIEALTTKITRNNDEFKKLLNTIVSKNQKTKVRWPKFKDKRILKLFYLSLVIGKKHPTFFKRRQRQQFNIYQINLLDNHWKIIVSFRDRFTFKPNNAMGRNVSLPCRDIGGHVVLLKIMSKYFSHKDQILGLIDLMLKIQDTKSFKNKLLISIRSFGVGGNSKHGNLHSELIEFIKPTNKKNYSENLDPCVIL